MEAVARCRLRQIAGWRCRIVASECSRHAKSRARRQFRYRNLSRSLHLPSPLSLSFCICASVFLSLSIHACLTRLFPLDDTSPPTSLASRLMRRSMFQIASIRPTTCQCRITTRRNGAKFSSHSIHRGARNAVSPPFHPTWRRCSKHSTRCQS